MCSTCRHRHTSFDNRFTSTTVYMSKLFSYLLSGPWASNLVDPAVNISIILDLGKSVEEGTLSPSSRYYHLRVYQVPFPSCSLYASHTWDLELVFLFLPGCDILWHWLAYPTFSSKASSVLSTLSLKILQFFVELSGLTTVEIWHWLNIRELIFLRLKIWTLSFQEIVDWLSSFIEMRNIFDCIWPSYHSSVVRHLQDM